jgi:FAD:protein FMN transferase
MGTRGSLRMRDGCDAALARITPVFFRIVAEMSSWVETSDVMRINRAKPGACTKVSPETLTVLRQAQRLSRATDGLFDITFFRVAALWEGEHVPSDTELKTALREVGFSRVHVEAECARLDHTQISLSGIAKGYAVDEAVRVLRGAGYRDFVLRVGGDLYASGRKGDERWRVGLRDPRATREIFAEVEVEDAAFSTSGDYERFFMKEGVRFHHILDPRTGGPARSSRAVTVRAKSCTEAEALTKALFVSGPAGLAWLLPRFAAADAVLIDAEGELHVSRGIARALHRVRPLASSPH